MSDETKIILGSKLNAVSIDKDNLVNIELKNTGKELDEFDRNARVSLAQLFDDERQSSNIFRLSSNIDFLFYNAYYGTTGISGYTPFRDTLYFLNTTSSFGTNSWYGFPQYNEFDFIRTDSNVSGYTKNKGNQPPHVNFLSKDATRYNWTQYISYVFENNFNKVLEYNLSTADTHNWVCSSGIPFYVINPYFDGGRQLIQFVCPMEHGLSEGDYIELEMTYTWTGYNGNKIFQIYSLGNEGYGSEKYIFNIENFGITDNSFYPYAKGNFKRIIDINNSAETKSVYYVRRHKIITSVDDSILTKAGFEQNGFGVTRQFEFSSLTPDNVSRITQKEGNQSYLLSFSKDIDISPLRDNWNRPVTELFISIINKGYFGWFNKPVYKNFALKQGYKFNLTSFDSQYWDNNNFQLNLCNIPTSSYVKENKFFFYYNQDLKVGDIIDGDYCEFNKFEGVERVVSNLFHKISFNDMVFDIDTTISSSVSNPRGYYYQPHYPLVLRVFSDYQEEGTTEEIDNIPDYAFYSNYKSKFIWRDLYSYGYVDENDLGVEFPFLNGTHYPFRKIIFRLIPEGSLKQNISAIAQPNIDDCE